MKYTLAHCAFWCEECAKEKATDLFWFKKSPEPQNMIDMAVFLDEYDDLGAPSLEQIEEDPAEEEESLLKRVVAQLFEGNVTRSELRWRGIVLCDSHDQTEFEYSDTYDNPEHDERCDGCSVVLCDFHEKGCLECEKKAFCSYGSLSKDDIPYAVRFIPATKYGVYYCGEHALLEFGGYELADLMRNEEKIERVEMGTVPAEEGMFQKKKEQKISLPEYTFLEEDDPRIHGAYCEGNREQWVRSHPSYMNKLCNEKHGCNCYTLSDEELEALRNEKVTFFDILLDRKGFYLAYQERSMDTPENNVPWYEPLSEQGKRYGSRDDVLLQQRFALYCEGVA